jgi:hypothetical protein
MGSRLTQTVAAQRARTTATRTPPLRGVPPVVHEVLRSAGQALDPAARAFMEPRLGHDFSRVRVHAPQAAPIGGPGSGHRGTSDEREADRVAQRVVRMPEGGTLGPATSRYDFGMVRVHTDAKAAESARAVNARAYAFGPDIVFGAGEYAPHTPAGRRVLAHELAHVAQQSASAEPRIQAFTAEESESRVVLRPEPNDTDADLNRVLCPAIPDRKIAGRTQIDITDCLPRGTVRAMTLGPYNCAQFIRFALAGGTKPAGTTDLDDLLTTALWADLLNSGYRVASFAMLDKNGKVAMAKPRKPLTWKQLSPAMGDLVFMRGNIKLTTEAPANREGDNFMVSWDHVGFFLVRSRKGFDYHLAKDGDENPIGVYHTGMKLQPDEGLQPGAYVKGAESLMAYLRLASVGMGDVKLREARDQPRPVGMGEVKLREARDEPAPPRP